jgi:hypothetical protein
VAEALEVRLERPFWPHVTLLRVRKGRRPDRPRVPDGLEPFAPAALTLYESRGGRYDRLGSKALPSRV